MMVMKVMMVMIVMMVMMVLMTRMVMMVMMVIIFAKLKFSRQHPKNMNFSNAKLFSRGFNGLFSDSIN